MRFDSMEAAIRDRAHRIWEEQDRPLGRDLDHWLQAEREVHAACEAEPGGLRVPRYQPEQEDRRESQPRLGVGSGQGG